MVNGYVLTPGFTNGHCLKHYGKDWGVCYPSLIDPENANQSKETFTNIDKVSINQTSGKPQIIDTVTNLADEFPKKLKQSSSKDSTKRDTKPFIGKGSYVIEWTYVKCNDKKVKPSVTAPNSSLNTFRIANFM